MKGKTVFNHFMAIFPSACLGAAGALLIAASVSTPTSKNIRVTRVTPDGGQNNYVLDLGILGGCTNVPLATYPDMPGPNCRNTQVGYSAYLLLPFDSGSGEGDVQVPPYAATRQYAIVNKDDSRDMVMVPIATGFEFLGLFTYLIASGRTKPTAGWIAVFWITLAMVLSWGSFAVVYQFTDRVQHNLRTYNEDPIAVIEPLTAHRGSATWFVLAAAALLTVALLGMVYLQYEKRKAYLAGTGGAGSYSARKSSAGDEEMEMS